MSLHRRRIALISASTAAAVLSAALTFTPAPATAETSADDEPRPVVPTLEYATSGTVHNSVSGSTTFDPWDDRTWVGFCDSAEVDPEEDYGTVIIDACGETPSSQRMVWDFDQSVLAELSPEDIESATFQVRADLAWVDKETCRQGALELYQDADWSQSPVGVKTYAASGCEGAQAWNGYFGFDATDLAKQAAAGDGSLTVGLKAADETCMSCGWNQVKSGTLQIVFNRAPEAPADLQVGTFYPGTQPCTSTPQWLNSDIYASAYVADPDTSHHNGSEKVTATFQVFPAGQSPEGTPLFELTATEQYADARIAVKIPPELLADGALYDLWVTPQDGYGEVGDAAHCTFGVDRTDPEPPTITPVVGGEAVYVADEPRGGAGIPGYFWISGGGSDVDTYRISGGSSASCGTGTSSPATATTGFSYTPDSRAVYLEGRVVACAVDKAGNWSQTSTYVFDVASSDSVVATPPAITVSGGSSYSYGSSYTSAITLSTDAATPYGGVIVSEGSTVLGGATFDARTKSVTIPAKKLAVGSHTLTYAYQAFPGAPKWSTTKVVKVVGTFVAPTPTISGTAKVGKTLTASRGTWTPTPSTVTYVWKAGTTTIKSSTSNQLVVPASAKGKQITVSVVGARSGYTTKTVTSAKTATVAAGTFTAPRPYLKGTVEYGHTVTAVRGTWSPSPSSVTYVWKINGTVVKRGTSSSLFLSKAWNGKQVTVTVIGSRAGYTSKTVTSYAKTI
ncbi:serine/arginine repetitive matrix protein 2 [Nocardioidaceae bacterium Broad-1]|nr:serine/arginine repetitive matrix protein 2 [Nocardioidaceae bacterium Broad-1]